MKIRKPLIPESLLRAARAALLILPVLALAILVFYVSQPLAIAQIDRERANVTPFILRLNNFVFDEEHPSGRLIGKTVVARRADGSIVRVSTEFGPVGMASGYKSRFITFWDGRQDSIFDAVQCSVPVPPISGKALAAFHERALDPPSNCVGTGDTLLGFEMRGGVRVAKISVTPPAGSEFVLTQWRAPDLGCAMVQATAQKRRADGSLLMSGQNKLVSLKLAPPDPDLFEVPSDYAKVKPSQALKREAEGLGIAWSRGLRRYASHTDAAYNAKMLRTQRQP